MLNVKTFREMDYEPYLQTLAFYKDKGFRLYETEEGYKPFEGQPPPIKSLHCYKPPQ